MAPENRIVINGEEFVQIARVGVPEDHPEGTGDGAAEPYAFVQNDPDTSWLVYHGLGYKPLVDVTDSSDTRIVSGVHHVNDNSFEVTHNAPTSGKAYYR